MADANQVLESIETGATLVNSPATTVGGNEAIHKGNMSSELDLATVAGKSDAGLARGAPSDLIRHHDVEYLGLEAWFPFAVGSGTTAYDFASVGSVYNGSFQGGPSWSTDSKTNGYSISFDGTDDVLSVSDATFDGFSQLTICAWAKTTASPTNVDNVVHKQDGGTSGFRLANEGGVIEFGVYAGGNNNGYTELNGATSFNDGTWHHIAGTWDGSNMEVFLDGTSDGTATQSDMADNNFTVGIGGDVNGNINYWDGKLDGIRIYKRALSQSTITDIMNGVA